MPETENFKTKAYVGRENHENLPERETRQSGIIVE